MKNIRHVNLHNERNILITYINKANDLIQKISM